MPAMNRVIALAAAALAMLLPAAASVAQTHAGPGARVVSTIRWVEEWDAASGQWVRVADGGQAFSAAAAAPAGSAEPLVTVSRAGAAIVTETIRETHPVRFIAQPVQRGSAGVGMATFGPFRVLDERRAALVGATDAASPQAFAAMMARYPGLSVIEFVDAPGTTHDLANLRLGRAIRAAGLATHVPAGGSARSGAVELFLAGTQRTVDEGALFAVHSWRDERGREPGDFAAEAPENKLYLDYYAEMGMSGDQARAFYAMTNSVPHSGALWLEGAEMARWIAPASRTIDGRVERALRMALRRSGQDLAAALGARLALPALALPPRPAREAEDLQLAPRLAPQLAFASFGAQGGAALLDSWAVSP